MAGILTPRDGARRVTRALGLALTIAAAATLAATASACGQNGAETPIVESMRSKPRPAPNSGAPANAATAANTTPGSASASPVATSPHAARPRVVVLGDSLTAGLGLPPQEAFPALLQRKIDADDLKFEVINAGVSGDTSAGGLRRLDWALDGDVQFLIVGLGANDGLRGLSVDDMRKNLSTIIERAQARHITVVLCGMEAPPNFGASYTTAFRAAYKDVAKKYDVALVPFLLDGVAGLPDLNQEDGIHPNARGAQKVADTVWSTLRPLLTNRTSSPS
jgi:acyl-CoA thioesterase-1